MGRLTIFLFCLLVLIATTTADEASRRKKLIQCVNKEMDKENAEFKLREDELKTLKEIVDSEAMKEPLKPQTVDEQKKILKDIEHEAKKKMPNVSADTVDKMMNKLKEKAMHCTKEMGE